MSDLISRADAIEAVCEECSERWKPYKECGLYKDGQCFEITALMALPSADAVHGEWNTGKPTKGGKYIVTLIGIGDYRFVDIMHYDKPCMPNKEVSGACWYRYDDEWGDVVYDDKDIIAWIPLPKPYECGARMKGGAE